MTRRQLGVGVGVGSRQGWLLSFVVPAHNEEVLLGRTLQSIEQACRGVTASHEVIVVDDASMDRTAEIAGRQGARVIRVNLRQIGAVRNAGAQHAQGDVLFFVDADTVVPSVTLAAALNALRQGAVGGGALVGYEGRQAGWARMLLWTWNWLSRFRRWAAGCFIFVRREAFCEMGGFDARYFAAEELVLSDALKPHGRFVILCERVFTSPRKAHTFSLGEVARIMARTALRGPKVLQRREGLELWYERREPQPNNEFAGS